MKWHDVPWSTLICIGRVRRDVHVKCENGIETAYVHGHALMDGHLYSFVSQETTMAQEARTHLKHLS